MGSHVGGSGLTLPACHLPPRLHAGRWHPASPEPCSGRKEALCCGTDGLHFSAVLSMLSNPLGNVLGKPPLGFLPLDPIGSDLSEKFSTPALRNSRLDSRSLLDSRSSSPSDSDTSGFSSGSDHLSDLIVSQGPAPAPCSLGSGSWCLTAFLESVGDAWGCGLPAWEGNAEGAAVCALMQLSCSPGFGRRAAHAVLPQNSLAESLFFF